MSANVPRLKIAWLVPPVIEYSGGHGNIFRHAAYLGEFGHANTIYCEDPTGHFQTDAELKSYVDKHYLDTKARFVRGRKLEPCDVVLATHWSTVEPVFEFSGCRKKFYFVQDYEPFLHPMGGDYLGAERTYRLGLSCITLGRWLTHLLTEKYGADCDYFDFAVDTDTYSLLPDSIAHNRICFYAQPEKPRRCFELGIRALEIVHLANPNVEIVLFGSNAHPTIPIRFPHKSLGIITPRECADLYRSCKAGIILSASNPSLIPVEMMACGCPVLDLDLENNQFDYAPGTISLAKSDPEALAQSVIRLLHDGRAQETQIDAALAMLSQRSLVQSAKTVEILLLRGLIQGRVAADRGLGSVLEMQGHISARQVSEGGTERLERKLEDQAATLAFVANRMSQLATNEQVTRDLSSHLAEKDRIARSLSSQLVEEREAIRNLSSQLAEKQRQIQNLASAAQRMQSFVTEKEASAQQLQSILSRMQNARGWRALQQYYRLRNKLFGSVTKKIKFRRELKLIAGSGLFDHEWYLAQYSDVAQAGTNPLVHYLAHGAAEGRDPNPTFDTSFYLDRYPDIVQAGTNPLTHYILHGAAEGRDPSPLFDTSFYVERYPDVAKAGANPLAHYLHYGKAEARLSRRDAYEEWIAENEPTPSQLEEQRLAAAKLSYSPLISVIMPVYNPPPEVLLDTIMSVMAQTYPNWELCVVDGSSDRPGIKELLKKCADEDHRIRVEFLHENLGISANSNEALKMAGGEFVALLDHDDLLAPFALFEVARFLNDSPQCDMIYSDEDKIEPDGRRHSAFFKPDWSPDLLQCFMYTGHLTVYRREAVKDLGGFQPEFDFSQDYDLALRVSEKANLIAHIPKVLYHWRVLAGSAAVGDKPFARSSNLAALASAMARRGCVAEIVEYPTANRVKFKLQQYPLVSIIIPTDHERNILACIEALLSGTSYPAVEIVIATNTKLAARISGRYASDPRVRTVLFDAPFNFSAKCNRAAREANGEFLLFLNDDVQCLDKAWIDCMLGYFQQDDVGAVSPKMIYSNGFVQHAGLVTGVRGFVGTAFHLEESDSTTYFNLLQSTRTVSALSAACLLLRKDVFDSIGGFDEINTPIMHSDIDLSFKIRERGLRLVYTPFTTLMHVGHVSLGELENERGHTHSMKANVFLLKRWGEYVSYDPYFTHNMRRFLYRDSPTPQRTYAGTQLTTKDSKGDVLFVGHELSMSGAPIILETLIKSILHEDYFVTLVTPRSGTLLEQCCGDGIPVLVDPLIYDQPSELRAVLDEFDVIVANTILSSQVVHVAKSLGKPVIWLVHEGDFGVDLAERDGNIRRALVRADVVIFPSRQTEQKYRKLAAGENFTTIHYGIEAPELGCEAPRPRSDATGKIRVVCSGSVEPRKGQDVLIRSITGMTQDIVSLFEFYFVGRVLDPEYYALIKAKTESLTNVHWVGEVSRDKSVEYIANSDVLVCTSRDETGPIVVMEAMSQGKAVVSTPVGVVPEIIEHEKSGLLFEIDNDRALADCLVRLRQDPTLLEKLGHSARRKFEEHLRIERYSQDIIRIINRLRPPVAAVEVAREDRGLSH